MSDLGPCGSHAHLYQAHIMSATKTPRVTAQCHRAAKAHPPHPEPAHGWDWDLSWRAGEVGRLTGKETPSAGAGVPEASRGHHGAQTSEEMGGCPGGAFLTFPPRVGSQLSGRPAWA